MEPKKPRLELLSDSDFETESESDSSESSSNVSSPTSSLASNSSFPPLTSSSITLTSSSITLTSSSIPLTSSISFTSSSISFTSSSIPLTTSNVPFLVTTIPIPNVLPSTAPNVLTFTTPNLQPLITPISYSAAAASKIIRPAPAPLFMSPSVVAHVPVSVIPNVPPLANPNVFLFAQPNMHSSPFPSLSTRMTSHMPIPSTSNMPTPSTSNMPTPSTSYMLTPSTSYMPTPSTSYMPTPSTSYMPTSSTSNMPTPSTSNMPTRSTSNMLTPSTSNMPTTSTSNRPSATSNLPPVLPGAANGGEQLRSSFRFACQELNHELDLIMHPLETKQRTLNSIEDYIVALSKRAKVPFKIELTDDSFSTKVSLKVDKNKVVVLSQNTPNHQSEDNQQPEGEGAASNAAGPSHVQNSGGACWAPPVNPFTSSVTLRQHLEAASHNVRPRRMRPPPGFHPTPQYNVTNDGASTSDVEQQNFSSGIVRPPPGFYGIAATPGSSNVPVPGPNTQEYYGLLDTQAIIVDLYRQSLSVVRQTAALTTSQATAIASPNPQNLLYSMAPNQRPVAELERRAVQGHRGSEGERQNASSSGASGNDLWQHFTNAAAASGSSIGTDEPGYWDAFLQREVYDSNVTSDQNSILWKQFEEYLKVHYAPGSLRTGSTIFTSDNTGPSRHGPVGFCRPRSRLQPQPRSRPIQNIYVQRNFSQQVRPPPNLGWGQAVGQQDVLTLSDRFKNAAISSQSNIRPRNRNALFGVMLQNRLMERIAQTFPETTSTNATMNFTVPTSTPSSANLIPNLNPNFRSGVRHQAMVPLPSRMPVPEQLPCSYCAQNNRSGGVPTHVLRDVQGRTVCPVLRSKPCPICNSSGDQGHSVHDCPIRKQWDMEEANKAARKSS